MMHRLGSAVAPMRLAAHAMSSGKGNASFVEKFKQQGAAGLLGRLPHKGAFDQCVEGLTVDKLDKESVKCSMVVAPQHCNTFNTLHGGAISTLVDIVGTLAILGTTRDHSAVAALTPSQIAGVSIDLNVSFLSAARATEEIVLTGRVLKRGKSLAYTQVDIHRKLDGAPIATGRHTKAFV